MLNSGSFCDNNILKKSLTYIYSNTLHQNIISTKLKKTCTLLSHLAIILPLVIFIFPVPRPKCSIRRSV